MSLDNSKTYWRQYAYFVVFFLPLALLDVRLPLPGVNARISDLYLISLVGTLALSSWEAQRWMVRCVWLFLPFIGYVIVSALVARNISGLLGAFQWVLTLLWIPVCAYIFRQADINLIKLLWACIFIVAVYVAVQHLAQGITYGFKHMAGAKYSFGFAVLLGCLLCRNVSPLIWLPCMVLCIVMLIFSDERKGMLLNVVTICGFVPMLLLIRGRSAAAGIFSVTLLLLFFSGPILYYGFIRGDLAVTSFIDEEMAAWSSDLHRQSLIANGIDIFLKNPFFGIGAKKLMSSMGGYYLDPRLGLSTHNFYLDFLIEYGMIGIGLFLVPIILIFMNLRRDHPLSFIFLPLGFYCLCVPMFMETGTTTIITFFTGIACLIACGWTPAAREISRGVPASS